MEHKEDTVDGIGMKETAKTKRDEILEFFSNKKEIISKFGVKKIGIFGSVVRNEQTEHSDVDVIVLFDEDKLSYENYIDLAYYLEDALKTDIDLVTADSLSPYIGPKILEEAVYAKI